MSQLILHVSQNIPMLGHGHPSRGLLEQIERVEKGLSEIIQDAQAFSEYLKSQGIGIGQ